MNQILIRTDANSQIGMGHFFRCLGLAGYLKKDHKISFLMQEASPEIQDILKNQGLDLKIISDNDLEKYLNNNIDLVLDGYHFDYNYQKKVKPYCKRLFYIDDLNEGKFCADYVINHSLSALEEDYPKIPGIKYLLGYDYVLLREEFLNTQPNRVPREKVENITICMGGADKDNLTLRLAESVLNLKEGLNLNLVFGAANKNLDVCQEKLGSGTIYHVNLNAQEMCDLLKKTDIVIAPASGIAYESISLGVLLITGIIAENQYKYAELIHRLELGVNLGWFSRLNSKKFKYLLKNMILNTNLRKKIISNQFFKIDRRSPDRIRAIFNEG